MSSLISPLGGAATYNPMAALMSLMVGAQAGANPAAAGDGFNATPELVEELQQEVQQLGGEAQQLQGQMQQGGGNPQMTALELYVVQQELVAAQQELAALTGQNGQQSQGTPGGGVPPAGGGAPPMAGGSPGGGAPGGGGAPSWPGASQIPGGVPSYPSNGGPTSGGPPGAQPSGNVKQWIDQAKQIMAQSGMDVSKISDADLNNIIQHESSGNPNAINNWDSNARAGHPSKGLMQTIDSTFNQYALPGHTNIWNPVDNIIAGTRYSIARYGSVSNVPGVRSTNNGGGYVGY